MRLVMPKAVVLPAADNCLALQSHCTAPFQGVVTAPQCTCNPHCTYSLPFRQDLAHPRLVWWQNALQYASATARFHSTHMCVHIDVYATN